MAYYVRLMREEDVTQVTEIDREAFPTQWPPPNYRHELKNQLAHYVVVCDQSKTVSKIAIAGNSHGLITTLKRWLGIKDGVGQKAVAEEYIAGFAGLWILADEAHITSIAVRESYRGHGIGELLLVSIIDLAMELKARIVTLEVRVSNTVAQNLYAKYAFNRVGLRKGYYTDNREDAVLMSTMDITLEAFQERFQRLKSALYRKEGYVPLRSPEVKAQRGT
ncbi:MAG: ribosomal protein S18-alanine N-acetyltransferase [Chloroflexi bacterium]|nr:ribosomal protein S18-alanine N-acetyltransferase [Chloroflexota bacterium]